MDFYDCSMKFYDFLCSIYDFLWFFLSMKHVNENAPGVSERIISAYVSVWCPPTKVVKKLSKLRKTLINKALRESSNLPGRAKQQGINGVKVVCFKAFWLFTKITTPLIPYFYTTFKMSKKLSIFIAIKTINSHFFLIIVYNLYYNSKKRQYPSCVSYLFRIFSNKTRL